jgi:hypothetical protein
MNESAFGRDAPKERRLFDVVRLSNVFLFLQFRIVLSSLLGPQLSKLSVDAFNFFRSGICRRYRNFVE